MSTLKSNNENLILNADGATTWVDAINAIKAKFPKVGN